MTTDFLNQDVCYIKGVGPRRAELLHRLSVCTTGDLIRLFPRDYEDWSPSDVASAPFDQPCCVRVTVEAAPVLRRISGGRQMYTLFAFDRTGRVKIIYFNNPYTAEKLNAGEEYLFYGRISGSFTGREMIAPKWDVPAAADRLHPVYPQTAGLHSRTLETYIARALEAAGVLPDPLPAWLREKYALPGYDESVRAIHHPADTAAFTAARSRLVFDELLMLQLGLFRLKTRTRAETARIAQADRTDEFFASLPFTPTAAQRRAAGEAAADLRSGIPMNRLIQGDVGCGKTAVAAALCHTAVQSGWQCAVMAPTGLLAEQHYHNFTGMFAPFGSRIGLLTGSMTASRKQEVCRAAAAGEIDILIGTHALLQDTVAFSALGLVVTDEQHRFGVSQRAALMQKGGHPHLLVMSATPIPRTLALILYGDLSVSVIDELPPGRTPVKTWAVGSALRERALGFVKKQLDAGRQAYIVCPLVEESDTDLLAAEEYYERLRTRELAGYPVGLLHGKLRPREKESVMRAFLQGKIKVLVATTVIEVGVDVPNASVMVVENAERFGLSQLHQLRGRVGRGAAESHCILISDAQNEEAKKRFSVLCETTDGFRVAEEDLKLRGPGDFFGSRQHGLPALQLADLLTDTAVLKRTSGAARCLLERDPALKEPEHAALRRAVTALFRTVGEDGLN